MTIEDLKTPLEEIELEEAEARGEARGVVQAVLDALEARFGPVAPEIAASLNSIHPLTALRHALRLAVTEPTLDSFRSKLPPPAT